jgi:hypothetical protein
MKYMYRKGRKEKLYKNGIITMLVLNVYDSSEERKNSNTRRCMGYDKEEKKHFFVMLLQIFYRKFMLFGKADWKWWKFFFCFVVEK